MRRGRICGNLAPLKFNFPEEHKVKNDIVFVLAIVGVVAVISLGVVYFLS